MTPRTRSCQASPGEGLPRKGDLSPLRPLSSVAALEFLARAAPARIVASDLSRRRRCGRDRRAHRRHTTRGRTAVAHGGRPASSIGVARSALDHLPHRWWRRRLVALHLDPEDLGHDRALDALAELVEHLERLVLVLDERIALAVRAQTDALAE